MKIGAIILTKQLKECHLMNVIGGVKIVVHISKKTIIELVINHHMLI